MKTTQQIEQAIVQQGMVPLYFHADEAVGAGVLRAIYRAGIRVVEYTNRAATARRNFAKLIEIRNEEMPDMLLGIGTIKNLSAAKDFLIMEADFLVSPGFVPEVADYAQANDIFYAPGCVTPTEIITAENAGIRFIKLFPGNVLGPAYVKSIKDIFPELLFMPTGGVDTTNENLESWFRAGVSAVGMGSKLISKELMETRAYDILEANTKEVMTRIAAIKNKK